MTITPELLADLKANALAATPGPWKVCPNEASPYEDVLVCAGLPGDANDHGGPIAIDPYRDDDFHFIAAANPQTVLALVDEIERLREVEALCMSVNEKWRNEIDGLRKALAAEKARARRMAKFMAGLKTYPGTWCHFCDGSGPGSEIRDDRDEHAPSCPVHEASAILAEEE